MKSQLLNKQEMKSHPRTEWSPGDWASLHIKVPSIASPVQSSRGTSYPWPIRLSSIPCRWDWFLVLIEIGYSDLPKDQSHWKDMVSLRFFSGFKCWSIAQPTLICNVMWLFDLPPDFLQDRPRDTLHRGWEQQPSLHSSLPLDLGIHLVQAPASGVHDTLTQLQKPKRWSKGLRRMCKMRKNENMPHI